jgi:hypothetical protein
MRNYFLVYFSFLSCTSIQAQNNSSDTLLIEKSKLINIKFILKTDALTLLDGIIARKSSAVTISGEMCFNKMYGIQLNGKIQKENGNNFRHAGYVVSAEFRRYTWSDDYSGLHWGVFCSLENANVSLTYPTLNYTESIFEAGFSGGYKLLVGERWVLDPSAFLGISNRFNVQKLEPENATYEEQPSCIAMRISLDIGWKF